MSKSILAIDTPECCDYCPVGRIFGMAVKVECMAGKDIRVNNNGGIIPNWCQLLDLPKKMAEENRWFRKDYAEGFNDCIDEILKGDDAE